MTAIEILGPLLTVAAFIISIPAGMALILWLISKKDNK